MWNDRRRLNGPLKVTVGKTQKLQDVFDQIASDYDLNGFDVTLYLDCQYQTGLDVNKSLVGGNKITVDGNGCTIVTDTVPPMSCSVGNMQLTVKNMKLGAWSGPAAINAIFGGTIFCAEGMEYLQGGAEHFLACYGGRIFILSDYTVSGGCVTHWHSYSDGYIVLKPVRIYIANGIWFSSRWAGVADASLVLSPGSIFIGANTHCQKYLVHKNGYLETNGIILPGDVAGSILTGGVLV